MSGFTVKPLNEKDSERIDKCFGTKGALLEFNPGRCLLPPHHAHFAQQIIDAPVREDDIWLISFPRTGSTWCQEMIWLLGNNLDFDTARNTIQQIRAPLIETSTVLIQIDSLTKDLLENSVDLIANLPSPRYIKSHLPLTLLPSQLEKIKPKIIYTCRNPKDMCVSYYHHCLMFYNYQASFEEFCDLLLQGLTPLGDVFDHYLGFWKKRHDPNILILKYEDMKRDLKGTLKSIAHFLGKCYTEDEYEKLCDFLSFEKMRDNKGCNFEDVLNKKFGDGYYQKLGFHFIRKGQVGDWKNYMSEEMAQRFDRWIEKNTAGTGLNFN